MFHKVGSRDATAYFIKLQKAFPDVRSTAELPSDVFGTCLDAFVCAAKKYKEYQMALADQLTRSCDVQ